MILFLHILLAFAAIALLVVPGMMLEMVAHTRDVPFIRRMYAIGAFHGKLGGPLALLTIVLGVVLAWRNGIPLGSAWLVLAYVNVAVLLSLGFGYHMRRELRIGMLAQTSPDAAPSPELAAEIGDKLALPMLVASLLLWILLIWVMTARPFA